MIDFANGRTTGFHTLTEAACAMNDDILVPRAGSIKTIGQQEKWRDAFDQVYFQDERCLLDATA